MQRLEQREFTPSRKAKLEEFTFGNPMVKGTVRTARTLETFFMVAAAGFPSIPFACCTVESKKKTYQYGNKNGQHHPHQIIILRGENPNRSKRRI